MLSEKILECVQNMKKIKTLKIEIIKFANEANKATYLELLKLDLTLDPVISIKSAPTEGNKIKEDKIGKFI